VTNWLPVSSIDVRNECKVARFEGFELPKRMLFSRDEEARVAAWWYMVSFLFFCNVSYQRSLFSHTALG
jgi:hypothetical protein